jgi:hypothetical protein
MAAGAVRLESVSGPAKGSMIAVGITAALGLVTSLVQLGALGKAQDFLDGSISEDEFEDSFAAASALSLLVTPAQIVAIIFTCIWLSRILGNHRKVLRQTTWSSGWGAGGWFLPPFLFVIPLLAIREAWQASSPDVPPGDLRWKQSGTDPMIWIWWVLYGLAPLAFITITFSRFGGFSSEAEDLAEMVEDTAVLGVVQGAIGLVAGIAFVVLVRKLTARHQQLIGTTNS